MPTLRFESEVSASPEEVWDWITSVRGILTEMAPIMRMTTPRDVSRLSEATVVFGKPIFRSWVLLFGFLPIDRSDLTLLSLDSGRGFVEESPMFSMKLWRHERTISSRGDKTVLVDQLTFEPRFAGPLVRWLIRTIFEHRHAMLRKHLCG